MAYDYSFHNNITSNWHPCYTPILRNITSDEELLEFEKFVFSIELSEGKKPEEIWHLLKKLKETLYKGCCFYGQDLFTREETNNLFAKFFYYSNVPAYSNCVLYYQQFQQDTNACYACKRSPFYANKLLYSELRILHYMMESRENYKEIKKEIQASGIEFLSVFDAYKDHNEKKTLYLPLNQFFYDVYREHGDVLFHFATISKEKWNVYLLNYFFDYTGSFIPDDKKEDEDFIKSILGKTVEGILSGGSSTNIDLINFFGEYKKWQDERNNRILTLSETNDFKKSPTFIPTFKYNVPKYTEPKPVEAVQSAKKTENSKSHASPKTTTVNNNGDISRKTTPSNEAKTNETAYRLEQTPEQKKRTQLLHNMYMDSKIKFSTADTISNSPIQMEIVLSEEQLSDFREINGNIRDLTLIRDVAIKKQMLPVEAVISESVPYIVLCLDNKLYYRTDMKNSNDIRIITSVLSDSSVRKVCYQPFLLYAFCYEMGIDIKNVYSLLTHYSFLHPNDSVYSLADLMCYQVPDEDKQKYKKKLSCFSYLWNSLRYYIKFYSLLSEEESQKNKQLIKLRDYWNYTLGCFYKRLCIHKSSESLFDLKSLSEFRFNNNYNDSNLKQSGIRYNFSFTNTSEYATDILVHFLCTLSKEEILKKYSFCLLIIRNNKLVFYSTSSKDDKLAYILKEKLTSSAFEFGVKLLDLDIKKIPLKK